MKKYRAQFYAMERTERGDEKEVYKGHIDFFVLNNQNPYATAFKRATRDQQNANVCKLEVL